MSIRPVLPRLRLWPSIVMTPLARVRSWCRRFPAAVYSVERFPRQCTSSCRAADRQSQYTASPSCLMPEIVCVVWESIPAVATALMLQDRPSIVLEPEHDPPAARTAPRLERRQYQHRGRPHESATGCRHHAGSHPSGNLPTARSFSTRMSSTGRSSSASVQQSSRPTCACSSA